MAAFNPGSELDHSVKLCTPAVIIIRREKHQLKKTLKQLQEVGTNGFNID